MTRYVGLDVHKCQITVAAVNAEQEEVLRPQALPVERFFDWAESHLLPDDIVALEASTNAWDIHDRLLPLVSAVGVANSHKVRLIASSPKKTDRHDARILARLLAAHLLPEVWVPPEAVRQLRSLTAHRTRLVRERTALKNQLLSILHRHNLATPEGGAFCAANATWWEALDVPTSDCLQIRHLWKLSEQISDLVAETEIELARLSVSEHWIEASARLIQIPGIGMPSAMTILAAIGEIERFPTAKQLVGYAGLGARVHASGNTWHSGRISKQGRSELRRTLIECAWMAVRWSPYWKLRYQQLQGTMCKSKAITAIAHKLLVTIWHLLTKHSVDRFADPQAIARGFMTWATQHRLAARLGIRRLEFVQQQLDRLGIRSQIAQLRYGGRLYPIALSPT
jgi:transposase